MIEVKIIKAGLTDLIELQKIGVRSYLPHYQHLWKIGGVDWYMKRCFGIENLGRELNDENFEYYFVRRKDENIGVMKLVLQKTLPDSSFENSLYLEKLYFVKDFTGKGIGKPLMQMAFNRASELKREYIWLTAMDTAEKPIAQYVKNGYEFHSKMRLGGEFKLMKEEFRGMVVMKRKIEL